MENYGAQTHGVHPPIPSARPALRVDEGKALWVPEFIIKGHNPKYQGDDMLSLQHS